MVAAFFIGGFFRVEGLHGLQTFFITSSLLSSDTADSQA